MQTNLVFYRICKPEYHFSVDNISVYRLANYIGSKNDVKILNLIAENPPDNVYTDLNLPTITNLANLIGLIKYYDIKYLRLLRFLFNEIEFELVDNHSLSVQSNKLTLKFLQKTIEYLSGYKLLNEDVEKYEEKYVLLNEGVIVDVNSTFDEYLNKWKSR